MRERKLRVLRYLVKCMRWKVRLNLFFFQFVQAVESFKDDVLRICYAPRIIVSLFLYQLFVITEQGVTSLVVTQKLFIYKLYLNDINLFYCNLLCGLFFC